MGLRTVTVAVAHKDPLYPVMDKMSLRANNLYNASLFRLRQIMTVLRKEPDQLTDNEVEVQQLKRLVKTPKLYFCDTGFCAYLSSWTTRDILMNGAASGHYFENYVVGELLRHYAYGKNKVNLIFFRDNKVNHPRMNSRA